MDLACTIEARSKESASSGQTSWTKSERWILSEWLVARELTTRGFELLKHRWKTPYAEVDLLFQTPAFRAGAGSEALLLIEVKTWNKSVYGDFSSFDILPRKQAIRLMRAREFVEAEASRAVRLQIAVVSYFDGRPSDHEPPQIHLFDPTIPHRGY